MRIPLISNIANYRKIKSEKIQAETKMIRERTHAIEKMTEAKEKALDAVIAFAEKPTMSLNDELYGNRSAYSSDIWQSNTDYARRISRIAYWESPAAQAMQGRFVDLVIGPKLELQSNPVWDIIPGSPSTPEERQKIIKNIESRYRLWAKSKKSDYILEKNHYQRSRYNFGELLIDGEYFVILRYSATMKRNPLSVQIIKPENVKRIDSKVAQGNTEKDGIEYNSKGAAVAYHILNATTGKSVRVPRFGVKSGRTFVIHNKLGHGRRGVGIFAGIISELTKLSDFQALEIQAAVINALFAVWVETEIGGETKKTIPKEGISGINSTIATTSQRVTGAEFEAKLNSTDFSHGGIITQNMGEGQKLHSFDTKRPTANFETFFNAVKRNLYSAKGMSKAVADYDFNGSYSAARGELLVFWNRVMTLRFDHSVDYEDEIFRMWLWGEIDNNNIDAPGWQDETIQDAWTNAYWTGPQRPDIDPLRSAKGAEIDSNNIWKTDAEIAAERGGGDWNENVERKIVENKMKATANEPIVRLEKTSYSFSENKTESKSESKTVEE